MTRTSRDVPATTRRLSLTLRTVGAGFVAFFGSAFVLVATDVPVTGVVASLTRWGHGGEAYELMITALYVVWGVYLWRAAARPRDHATFLDFTLAANAAHFGVMLALGLSVRTEHLHLAGDVLLGWVAIAAIAATWLPVRARVATDPSRAPSTPRSRPAITVLPSHGGDVTARPADGGASR